MKITKVALVAVLLLAAKQASALFDVSAFGGYATVSMSDVNGQIDQLAGIYPSFATVTTKHISSGFYVGADAAITVFPFIKVGPRLEYLGDNRGEVDGSVGSSYENYLFDTNMMLYEIGLSTDIGLPLTGLSVQGGIWGGYGVAGGKISHESNVTTPGSTTISGGGFVGEVGVQARYKIIPMISIGLDLGYRVAKISQMTAANDAGIVSSGTLKDNNNNDLAFDFSGLNAGGSVSFNF